MTQVRRAAAQRLSPVAEPLPSGRLEVVCGSVRAHKCRYCSSSGGAGCAGTHRCSGKWVRGGGGGGMRRREMAEQQEEEEEEEMFAERKKRRKRFQRSWKRKSHPIHESGLI